MFEGIRRNIAQTKAKLRRLDIGRTRRRLTETRRRQHRHSQARREYLEMREEALAELQKLIDEGRDPQDEHLRNLRHRANKADLNADEHGETRADLRRLWWSLRRILRKKNNARDRLLKQLGRQRRNLRRHRREHRRQQQAPPSPVGYFDGKAVASWIVPILQSARNNGWNGTLTSGYRTPAYSTQLCYSICGAPTCPGRCAGAASNHCKLDQSAAVDVSDPYGFARAQSTLRNALGAADPWHFSKSGY